jgi:Caspase domain
LADAPNWATGRTHRALLIGNGRLGGASERFGPLRSPPADVAALRTALTDAERGLHSRRHVQVVLDAPRERVLAALRAFFDGAGPQDQLLLFYSGHGLADERAALHLGTSDTMAQFPVSTAVPAEVVGQLADTSPAAAVLIVLDCR